jgi:CheY-like chemotaxis protein
MKKIKVLLVDDDEVDYMNVKRAFKKNQLIHELQYKHNGLVAIEYLREVKDFSELPNVIILDINMPQMNGHEFLDEIRQDDRLKHIVVYILTTSSQDADVSKAYTKQVSGYLLKPLDFDEFRETINKLDGLWGIQKFSNGNR